VVDQSLRLVGVVHGGRGAVVGNGAQDVERPRRAGPAAGLWADDERLHLELLRGYGGVRRRQSWRHRRTEPRRAIPLRAEITAVKTGLSVKMPALSGTFAGFPTGVSTARWQTAATRRHV